MVPLETLALSNLPQGGFSGTFLTFDHVYFITKSFREVKFLRRPGELGMTPRRNLDISRDDVIRCDVIGYQDLFSTSLIFSIASRIHSNQSKSISSNMSSDSLAVFRKGVSTDLQKLADEHIQHESVPRSLTCFLHRGIEDIILTFNELQSQ
jgi:hypothetical protein